MEFSIKFSNEMDPIAAAALTLTLLQLVASIASWWFRREKIRLYVGSGRIFVGGGFTDDNVYISIRVTNVGDKPITLRSVTMVHWNSLIHKMFKRSQEVYFLNVMDFDKRPNVPAIIDIGQDWHGFIVQTPRIELMMSRYLEIQANHSLSLKPITKRLKRKS